MLHKSYQTGMLPNLSNAALFRILWVKSAFTKSGLSDMLEISIFNVSRWPLESFLSITVCWGLCEFFATSGFMLS
jgi:hypothetical protein